MRKTNVVRDDADVDEVACRLRYDRIDPRAARPAQVRQTRCTPAPMSAKPWARASAVRSISGSYMR